MPIQFRCQHCRQLLGISRSKAGSIVDCPACGRSLRVPMMDGGPARPEPLQRPDNDSGLQSALEILSGFSVASIPLTAAPGSAGESVPLVPRGDTSPPRPPRRVKRTGSPPKKIGEHLEQQGTVLGRDSIGIVSLTEPATDLALHSDRPSENAAYANDVLKELAQLPAIEDSSPQIIPEIEEPEFFDEPIPTQATTPVEAVATSTNSKSAFDLPDHLASALEELAGNEAAVKEVTSKPAPKPVTLPSSPSRLPWILTAVALTVCGLIGGYVWGHRVATANQTSPPSLQKSSAADVDGNAAPAIVDSMSDTLPPVSGGVRYADAAGQLKPDSGALILLLPATNASGLKLDARPLRDEQTGVSRNAVEAALTILEASVTRADDDGSFSLKRLHRGPMRLLIISRHASRPDDEPVAPALVEPLAQWFDSPTHITGRLAVKQEDISAASEVDNSAPRRIEMTM